MLADENVRDPRRVSARDAAAADPEAAHAQSRNWKEPFDDTPTEIEVRDKPDLLALRSVEQRHASEAAFVEQCAAARGIYPDFDDAIKDAEELSDPACYMIMQGGLPNGPTVVPHLGKNPEEIRRINRMPATDQQHHIKKLSAQLATGTLPIDEAPYSQYRRWRENVIKNRYR